MATTSTAEFLLKFIPQLADDKFAALLRRIVDNFKSAAGNIDLLDLDQLEADINALQGELDDLDLTELEFTVDEIDQTLQGLEAHASAIDKLFEGLGADVDLDQLEAELEKLSDSDLDKLTTDMQNAFNNFDADQAKREMDKLITGFNAAKREAEELLAQQKSAAAAIAVSVGRDTQEYRDLAAEIKKTEQRVREFAEATDAVNAPTEDFASFFAKFEALQGFAGELSAFAEKGVEARDTMRAVAAQTGVAGEELESLGDIADDVFVNVSNSASLGEVIKDVGAVKQVLKDTFDNENLEVFTTGMTAFKQVFEKEVPEAVGKSAPFIKNFGLEGKAAFDLIAYGQRNTLTGDDDFLDTLKEYSVHFEQAGFAAEGFVGLLERGVDEGAFNTDKLADGVKESIIRITSAGGEVKTALAEISGAPQDLVAKISKSVDDVKNGTLSIKDMLQLSAKGIQEAYDAGQIGDVVKKQLEIAIGGTPLEEVGTGMFTKLFSAPIDEAGIREKAAQAGEQIVAAVGPVTTFEKFTKEVDLFFTKASESVAPFIAGAGAATESVSKIAPALSLVKDVDLGAIQKQFSGVIEKASELGGIGAKIAPQLQGLAGKLGSLGPALANPWVLGTAAAVGALAIFFTQTERGQKMFAELKEKANDLWQFLKPIVDGIGEVLGSTVGLLVEVGALLFEILIAPIEIAITNIELVIDLFASLFGSVDDGVGSMDGLGDALSGIAGFIDTIAQTVRMMAEGFAFGKDVYQSFIQDASNITAAFADFAVTALNPVNWFDGDVDAAKAKLAAALDKTVGEAVKEATDKAAASNLSGNLTEAISLKGDLDKNNQLGELVKKFQQAKSDVERASIAEQIQKEVPGAVKATGEVIDAQGNLVLQYEVAGEKVAAYAESQQKLLSTQLDGKQGDIVKGIEAQSTAYAAAKVKQQELADEIVAAAGKGQDVTALKKKYDDITAAANEQAAKIKENIGQAAEIKIDLTGAEIAPEFESEFQAELKKVEVAAREAKIGEAVTAAVSIKGSLDQQGQIEQLVAKFKAASTDVEKNSLAKQIQSQMPGVVQETLKGVDANGQLVRSFEVNTEAALANAQANKSRFSADLFDQQQTFRDGLASEGKAYEDNMTKAEALTKEINEKRAMGIDTTELERSLSDTQQKIISSRADVLEMAQGYERMGLTGSDAIRDVSRSLGISEKEAAALLAAQKKFSEEAKKSASNVDTLAEAFGKAKSAADAAVSQGIAAISELSRQVSEARAKGDIETAQQLQQQIDAQVASTRAQVKEKKALQATEERVSILVGETVVQGKSAFEIAKERYALKQQELENDAQVRSIAFDRLLIEQNREKTSRDELVQGKQQLENIRQQREEYLQSMAAFVRVNEETGAVEITTKKKEYRKEIQDQLDTFDRELQSQQNSVASISLTVAVDDKEFEQLQSDLDEQQLQVNLDLGITSSTEYIDILESRLSEQEARIAESNERLLKFDEQYAGERARILQQLGVDEAQANAVLQAAREDIVRQNTALQSQVIEKRAEIRGLISDVYQQQLSDSQEQTDAELAELQSRHDREIALLETFVSRQAGILSSVNDRRLDQESTSFDDEENRRLSELEDLKERELLTEQDFAERKLQLQEEYQAKREESEQEHARRQLLIEESLRGQQLITQVAQDKERLLKAEEAKRRELEIAQKLAEGKSADSEEARAAAKLSKELDAIQEELRTKGDVLVVLSGELQGTITDTMQNLFTGDEEEAKKPFRKLMAVLAGVLERTASGLVTKLILDQLALTPGGLLALLATPLIESTVSLAVGGVIRPVLNSLTSFASGGRVDEPTFALVGDAARLGNENTEWILRDEHIKYIVQQTSQQATAGVQQGLQAVVQAINALEGRFYVLQTDVYAGQGRVVQEQSRRGR